MLKRKLYRDLRQNLSQFIVIFVMVMLSVMAFAGVHAYMDGMRVSGDKYYAEYNLADMWLTGENFSAEDMEKITSNDNVDKADRRLTVQGTLEGRDGVTLEMNLIEENEVCRMYVFEGTAFDPKDTDSVWVDREFARANGYSVGDSMTLKYTSFKMEVKIAGLVETPDHTYSIKDSTEIFPDHHSYGYVYLSSGVIPFRIPFPFVMIDLKDPSLFDETKLQLEEEISAIAATTGRTELASWVGYNSEVEEGETYAFVFTFLLLFIAILSVITTMNRFIRKERTQIGTLKALGYRRRRIILHYISYNLVLSLIAAAAGIVVGVLTIGRFFLKMEMEYFEVPEAHMVLEPVVFIAAALSVLLIAAVTWLSCRKILNEPASQALRTEVPTVRNTNFSLTTRGLFRNASTVTKWNLRDIGRNKGRSLAGIAGIMGCVMLVVTALGMHDTIQDYLSWQFDKINHYESYIVLSSDYTDSEYEALISEYGDETSQTIAFEMQEADGTTSAQTLFVNDAPEHVRTTDHDRRAIEMTDEGVWITEKLSGSTGLGIGDEFTFTVYGEEEPHTARIAGTCRDPQSQRFFCTKGYLESLGMTYRADTIYVDELLDRSRVPEGAEVIQTREGLETGVRNMLDRMNSVIVLFIALSAVLAVVILYNLGILSFSEKQYQFATLKVLGYRAKPLRRIFNQQGRILAVISIALGLPAGYFMVSYIFSAALGDNYDFRAYVSPQSFVIAGAAIFLVSGLVNYWLSGRIRKIDMVSSLKANE